MRGYVTSNKYCIGGAGDAVTHEIMPFRQRNSSKANDSFKVFLYAK